MLLALAAIDETRASDGTVLPEAESALHRAVSTSRIVLTVPGIGGDLDWSPDGRIFVTEGPEESGLIDIRDADTGEPVLSFHGHDVDINDVAFSSDGSMLATAGDDGAVRVWDPTSGAELLAFDDEDRDYVLGPSFSPDGSRVAAAWPWGAVRIFDLATGELTSEIAIDGGSSTDFSPDGKRLAIASAWLPDIPVVDAASGEELFTLTGSSVGAGDVGWSPDGRWIAATGLDSTVRIWDADTGEPRFVAIGHDAAVIGLDWSPDGTRLATGSEDGTASISEVSDDGIRELLSFSAGEVGGGLGGVALSPDGERLMTGNSAVTAVKVWDASTSGGGEWANVAGAPLEASTYGLADYMADGRGLVVSRSDGTVTVSDIETGERRATIEPTPSVDGESVGWLDASADGQLIATASSGGPVDVWDAATGEHRFAVGAVVRPDQWVWGLAWSPDAQLLAVVVNDEERGEVLIVDRSGAELARLAEEPGQHVESVSFSPDGHLVATTRTGIERLDPTNMAATIWDWERGEVVRTIGTNTNRVAFDSTGARVATSRLAEGIVDVWDAETGERVATLSGPGQIGDLIYSPDGSTVATAHSDGTVRLWDPETGVERLVLRTDGRYVTHVVFGPDGSTLTSVSEDGIVRVWALDLDDLIGIADDRLTRPLSDAECRQYLHVERCPDA